MFWHFWHLEHWQWLQVMLDANDARKMRMTHCFMGKTGQDWARRRRQGDKDVFRARLSTNCKRQIEAACCMSLGKNLSLSSWTSPLHPLPCLKQFPRLDPSTLGLPAPTGWKMLNSSTWGHMRTGIVSGAGKCKWSRLKSWPLEYACTVSWGWQIWSLLEEYSYKVPWGRQCIPSSHQNHWNIR